MTKIKKARIQSILEQETVRIIIKNNYYIYQYGQFAGFINKNEVASWVKETNLFSDDELLNQLNKKKDLYPYKYFLNLLENNVTDNNIFLKYYCHKVPNKKIWQLNY